MIKIFNSHNFNLRLISNWSHHEITCLVHDQHLRWLKRGGAKTQTYVYIQDVDRMLWWSQSNLKMKVEQLSCKPTESWRSFCRGYTMKCSRNWDGHDDDSRTAPREGGGKAKWRSNREFGRFDQNSAMWQCRQHVVGLWPHGWCCCCEEGRALWRTLYVKVQHVKAKNGHSWPGLCVPRPRSEDTHVKKKPLAAVRIILQRRKDNDCSQSASDPQNLRDNSDLEKSHANATAGTKRSWASLVKGTDLDNLTSVKNNEEATKGESCRVQKQEWETMAAPTKMENTGEDGTNTRQDQLGDNQELDTKKKISEMEKTNEKLLKKEEGYKNKGQQLGEEVEIPQLQCWKRRGQSPSPAGTGAGLNQEAWRGPQKNSLAGGTHCWGGQENGPSCKRNPAFGGQKSWTGGENSEISADVTIWHSRSSKWRTKDSMCRFDLNGCKKKGSLWATNEEDMWLQEVAEESVPHLSWLWCLAAPVSPLRNLFKEPF